MKDYFSQQSSDYARFRPKYPSELFDHIIGFVNDKNLAWDCGTGNGQSAVQLAKHFNSVYATDISKNQILHAYKESNITYAIESSSQSSLNNNTVNLITVSQALHWFNLDKFYAEVKRVGVEKAIIAVWTYALMKIDPEIDGIILHFYSFILKDYWDVERKYIDEEYKSIPFPFIELPIKDFNIEVIWTLNEMEGYLSTWSAVRKYISLNNVNPVPVLIKDMKNTGPLTNGKVIFPVHMKIGLIH